jgi:hypothetical protein
MKIIYLIVFIYRLTFQIVKSIFILVEKFSPTNVKPIVLLDKIKPFISDEILNELIMSPISNSSLDQYQGTSIENDCQK